MKKIFYIMLFMQLLTSCEKEMSTPMEKDGDVHTLTFNLSGIESPFDTNITRASGKQTIDLNTFDVMFYLFKQVGNDDYQLVVKKAITEVIFKIDAIEPEVNYKYVIVAAPKKAGSTINPILVAKDYNTMDILGGTFEVGDATVNSSIYNCFFDMFGTRTYSDDDAITIDKNPEIFADGFDLSTSYDFHTPVDVVLKRQMGAVEFKVTGLSTGTEHTFACSIPSDYYRLYLSQIVRESASKDYTSQNNGLNDELNGYGVDAGDYYGKIASVNSGSTLLSFTKQETITTSGSTYNFCIYMPYTIASESTVTTSLYNGGNANTSEALGAGTLIFTVDGKTYTYSKPFPIYRNKKSYFLMKGDNELECKLGNINLDDDPWDGNN